MMDQHRQWLKEELQEWKNEELVTEEAAEAIWEKYRHESRGISWTVPLFVTASFCLLAGMFFLGAGFWNRLSQEGRFCLALVPVVASLFLAAILISADRTGGKLPKIPKARTEGIAEIGENAEEPVLGIPMFLREGVGIFHGLSVTAALWMVHESFYLNADIYDLAGIAAVTLLVMLYVLRSAGLGIIFAADTAVLAWMGPAGWPDAAAWLLICAGLPFFFFLVGGNRRTGGIAYAWSWMAAVLVLTFCTAADTMWQVLFFSVAASLTWLLGAALRSYGWIGMAFRFFGGAAVFCVLLASAFGTTWQAASGGWLLWLLLLVFLAADGALLWKTAGKKEWLSIVAGFTPFVMTAAGLLSLWDGSGASSAILVSCFILILAAALSMRGLQMGRNWQLTAGLALLVGDGIIRLSDATLTFGQRGSFFLVAGLLAAAGAAAAYFPKRLALRRRRKREDAKRQKETVPEETEGGSRDE